MDSLYKTVNYRNYNLFNERLENLDYSRKLVIDTINQYSFCIAEIDPLFKTALKSSDVLLPDGVGIVVAAKMIGENIEKISGSDVHNHLLNQLNKQQGRCFYVGSTPETLLKIKEKILIKYPDIVCETYSPPFKKELSEKESLIMLHKINKFKPDVVFIGMTAPKQEKWVHMYKDSINANVVCSIGAVFDFFAGTVKRPSAFWIKLNLEWFIRLCKEPNRMFKRYLVYGPIFVHMMIKEMIQYKFSLGRYLPASSKLQEI